MTFFSVMHNKLVALYLHNITVLSNSTDLKTLKSVYLFPKAHT